MSVSAYFYFYWWPGYFSMVSDTEGWTKGVHSLIPSFIHSFFFILQQIVTDMDMGWLNIQVIELSFIVQYKLFH